MMAAVANGDAELLNRHGLLLIDGLGKLGCFAACSSSFARRGLLRHLGGHREISLRAEEPRHRWCPQRDRASYPQRLRH